ncbi:hypothetical protein [Streptomyces sp. NPDC013457]|uniref:hypothetical protein n=1 Tax=Streptomyces sp. NPDC013457 TaxID=3364866 RepID=UPI0037022F39
MSDPQHVNRYDGPVFNGPATQNQLAWNSENVTQNQQVNSAVAPGYEELAARMTELLRQLPEAGLGERDREEAEDAVDGVLEVITRPDPEESKVRRALATLRGVLAPVATGVAAGTTVGAQEWARAAIEGLIV